MKNPIDRDADKVYRHVSGWGYGAETPVTKLIDAVQRAIEDASLETLPIERDAVRDAAIRRFSLDAARQASANGEGHA